jgi:ABC-type phosphate/phosphonate transport system substrate-binding protein
MGQHLRRLLGCLLLCFTTLSGHAASANQEPASRLILGLLPSQSPVTQFKNFAPMRDYLVEHLQGEVEIAIAKDYAQHMADLEQHRYDMVFTAPHMALYASEHDSYLPIATFDKSLAAVVVVEEHSAFHDLADLARATIATPSEKAIVTMVGKDLLSRHGLTGVDRPRYQVLRTHNAAYKAVLARQADAAIISNIYYAKARAQGAKLRKLGQSHDFPGIGVMVSKKLPATLRERIRDVLIHLGDTEAGRRILQHLKFPAYRAVEKDQFESLRPYLPALEAAP